MATISRCDRCGAEQKFTTVDGAVIRSTTFGRKERNQTEPPAYVSIVLDLCRQCFSEIANFIRTSVDRGQS